MNKYTTKLYPTGTKVPEQERLAMEAMSDLVTTVLNKFVKTLNNPDSRFKQIHPCDLLTVVTTNIICNLFFNVIDVDSIPEDQCRQMGYEMIAQMQAHFLKAFDGIISQRINTTGSTH